MIRNLLTDYATEIPIETIRLFIDTLQEKSATLQELIQNEIGPVRKKNAEETLASLISFIEGYDIRITQQAA